MTLIKSRMSALLLDLAAFVLFGDHVVKVCHFFDGVTYAGIARQMSMGIGTIDCPQYTPFLALHVHLRKAYLTKSGLMVFGFCPAGAT